MPGTMRGWPRLQERAEQGQSSSELTKWCNESQRQPLGNVSGYKRGSDGVHSLLSSSAEEHKSLDADYSLHLMERDLKLLTVSLTKPFKYPLLTLKRRSHHCSPQHRGTSIRRAVQLFRPSFSHQQIQMRTRYETELQERITRVEKQIRNPQQVGLWSAPPLTESESPLSCTGHENSTRGSGGCVYL